MLQYANTSTSLEVISVLNKLNSAKHIYDTEINDEARYKADKVFADCYDWLTRRGIAIDYNRQLHLWFLSETTFYTSRR